MIFRFVIALACLLGRNLASPIANATAISAGLQAEAIEQRENGLRDHYVKELGLGPEAKRDLKDLGDWAPHGLGLTLHGKDSRDSEGRFVSVPDTAAVAAVFPDLALDAKALHLLAVIVSSFDNILLAERSWDRSPNRGDGAPPGDNSQAANIEQKRALCKRIIERNSRSAALAYAQLKQDLRPERMKSVRQALIDRAVQDQIEKQSRMEESRRDAVRRCKDSLSTCSFPEGVPANCAGYLNMTVEELRKHCPVTRNSSETK